MNSAGRFLFAAVHQGPYLSIQPVEDALGADRILYLVEGVSREARAQKGLPHLDLDRVEGEFGSLEGFLREMRVQAVIRSSSEDDQGRNPEDLAAAAATNLNIPVFAVEDFPGNYRTNPGHRLDGLFVEDDSLTEFHRSRGVDPRVIHGTGIPRYDRLSRLDSRERRTETRMLLALQDDRVVLWAGQPDGPNSYLTLERLLHSFRGENVTLLFRAHPRDQSYASGEYAGLLEHAAMKLLDVSSFPDAVDLYCASDLVITQFSSAGVEAGHLGVPALFVLFDDLGKEYLRRHKGYETLPWCQGSCAFLIEREDEAGDVMQRALFDEESREEVRANFQHRFGTEKNSAQVIADQIRQVIGEGRPRGRQTALC